MKILFVHNHLTSFVRHDLECLRERHQVTELCLKARTLNPAAICRQVAAHDAVFGWFASWHTFLPMLFARCLKRPSVLVIGGYDLATLPQIGYGHQRGGAKKWVSRATMRLASALVTNSRYSEQEAKHNAGLARRRVRVIYHGVINPFPELPAASREPMAITVGNVERANLRRKGLEPFVRAAGLLPDVRFVVIGRFKDDAIEQLRKIASPNVEFTGWIDDERLRDYCRRASVYVQASRHEGFGMAVAEAMIAGCIPVVTNDGALPEVAGDCGVYSSAEPRELAQAIAQAIQTPQAARARARQRILSQFSLAQRSAQLDQTLCEVAPEALSLAQGAS